MAPQTKLVFLKGASPKLITRMFFLRGWTKASKLLRGPHALHIFLSYLIANWSEYLSQDHFSNGYRLLITSANTNYPLSPCLLTWTIGGKWCRGREGSEKWEGQIQSTLHLPASVGATETPPSPTLHPKHTPPPRRELLGKEGFVVAEWMDREMLAPSCRGHYRLREQLVIPEWQWLNSSICVLTY